MKKESHFQLTTILKQNIFNLLTFNMKKIALLFTLLFVATINHAKTITGKISDTQQEPIPNAVVILQNRDSSFISATTTDSLGIFKIEININNGLVLVQHLAYESQTITFSNNNFSALKNITLADKTTQLDGVTIKAQAPTVVVKDNALVYNAQRIAEKKAVNSAFELLKYTPGITTKGDEIGLAGASQLTVIVDGKATTLSNGDIAEMLKAMPASSVGNIEVMYKAPAKYGVKGALINIETDKKHHNAPVEAELATEYEQKFYALGRNRANVAYRGEKLDFDILVNTSNGNIRSDIYDYAINKFNNEETIIDQYFYSKYKIDNLNIRTSIDYKFNDDNSISLLYYTKGRKSDKKINSAANFISDFAPKFVNSINNGDDKNTLHNINLKGTFSGLELTADYVSYYDDDKSKYTDIQEDSTTTDYHNNSTMDIDQLKLLASYDLEINDTWQMSFGAQGTFTNSGTEVSYLYPQNGAYLLDNDTYEDNMQKERRFSVFAETFNTIFDSVQFDFTLELEYFKSDYDENGTVSTLWNEWRLYPSLSVTWPIKNDILQLSLSTYKNYPNYWDLSPHMMQINPYKFIIGNPELKPSTMYDASLAYILNQQYTIEAYCFYEKNAFYELPYQNAEECRLYDQTVNYDYDLQCGIGGELPFTIGFWEPTLSGYLIYAKSKKSDFHGSSFNKDKMTFSLGIENTFTISEEKPNLRFTLDAEYMSKAINGIYDMNYCYNLEVGMRWAILENLIFTAKWSDIFEHSRPYPATVNFNGQYTKLDRKLYNTFNTSLVWRIGGFKAKEVEMTDTQRMMR